MKTRKGYVVKIVNKDNRSLFELRNYWDRWRVFKTRAAALKAIREEPLFNGEKVVVVKYTRVYG